MIDFRLVQTGFIEITEKEGVTCSRPTSSLLECGAVKVLIDLEHPREDGAQFAAALDTLGVSASDIQAVIFTHLHPDHIGHKELFPNSVFVFHAHEKLAFYFNGDRTTKLEGSAVLELAGDEFTHPRHAETVPDLKALGNSLYAHHCPGHTRGSVVVFACIKELVHAFAGDVFLNRAHYERWEAPGSSWNRNRVYEHMEFVRRNADVIIPGHGPPFSTA